MSAPKREFVDTNILVYAHDLSPKSKPKHDGATRLLARLWDQQLGCLSTQVLQEFYVTVTKKIAIPLAPERAIDVAEDFSAWSVHDPTVNDVLSAMRTSHRHHLSLWDALIVRSAVMLDCGVLWTEDLNSGQTIDGVTVRNPFRDGLG